MAVDNLSVDKISDPALGPADPAQYVAAIGQRKWLIILLALTAAAAAYLVGIQQTVYQASTTAVLSPQAVGLFNTPAALNQIVDSDQLTKEIITAGRLKYSRAELNTALKIENVSGSSMIVITATDGQAIRAQRIANLASAKFVSMVREMVLDTGKERALATVNKQLGWISANLGDNKSMSKDGRASGKNVEAKIAALEEELARAKEQSSGTSSSAWMYERLSSLEEQRINLRSQQIGLMAQRADLVKELRLTRSTRVLIPAEKPTVRVFPSLTRNTALALIAALLAGSGLALAFPAAVNKDI